MVNIINPRKAFSSIGKFVLYDWIDSEKEEFYFHDEMARIYFFVKDLHPAKVVDELFVEPMKKFKFKSGILPLPRYTGNVVDSDLKYLFTGFVFPRATELNWAWCELPIKRDPKLSSFKNETEIMKYLSRFID